MSAFKEIETEMIDQGCLAEALRQLGHVVEVHNVPVNLEGYQGDQREQKADVVLPRKFLGSSSNDVGFVREKGKYRAIISDYDRSKYNQKWLNRVQQEYGVQLSIADARRHGLRLKSRETVKTSSGSRARLHFTQAR